MGVQTKDYRFEIKAVGEDGTFEGYLSVYGVVDLGNDVVEKGAFTKTIQEQKGVVPMLWAHDQKQPLGILNLEDDELGLKVSGEFFLEASEKAREMHAMSKAYLEKGRAMGLSIGYEPVGGSEKNPRVKGIRHLRELKLHEGSLTLFPMLPVAQMTAVKQRGDEKAADFLEELEMLQTRMMRSMMCDALMYALDGIVWDWSGEMDAAAKVQASDEAIMQFHAAYTEFLPKLLELWGEKQQPDAEQKAGRKLSASSRAQIQEAMDKLHALLDGDSTTSDDDSEAGKSLEREPHRQDSTKPGSPHLPLTFDFKSITEVQ
jgi:HK97 family phage prohead protease